jgi:hypothetical protein
MPHDLTNRPFLVDVRLSRLGVIRRVVVSHSLISRLRHDLHARWNLVEGRLA